MIAILPRHRRYARSLCRSPSVADHQVQTACLKALAKATSWQPGTRFDAWMFRILRNAWIDGLRHMKVEALVDGTDGTAESPGVNGEAEAVSRLTLEDVRRAIERLPDEQRDVLMLVCVEDMAYREAAEILDVPIGTVMSRLARARRKLNDMVGAPGLRERAG